MFTRDLDEVVEDSEPEREALRQQRRLARRRRVDPPIEDVVIDLSEEEEAFPKHCAPPPPSSSPSIIDISDDSLSVLPRNKSTTSPTPPPFESEESEIEIHALPLQSKPMYNVDDSAIFEDSLSLPSFQLPSSSRKPVHGRPQTEELSDDEDDGLNLSRFAFKAPQPTRARKEPTTMPKPRVLHPPAPKNKMNLNKLLKCVCCNLAWTARKSGAQKLVHLRSCAKKLAFSDETVRVRMTQYLATVVEPVAKTNNTPKDTSGTYFQDIVQEAAPKKRTRRVEAVGTVKAPEDTRDSILRRAQTVLGSSSVQSTVPATQAFAPSVLGDSGDVSESEAEDSPALPLTHPFGASKFARPMCAESDDEAELPPSTQAFALSKFGAKSRLLSRSRSPSSPILSRSHFLNIPDDSPPASTNSFLPSSSSVHLPMSPLTSRLMRSPDYRSQKEAKMSLLDMDVEVEGNIYDSNDDAWRGCPGPLALPVPETPTKPGRKKQSKVKSKDKDVTKTVASRWKEEEFDDQWEQQMKGKIKADEDLYFRILRYELATVVDRPVSGMLKYQVRVFLDKQAITFYGGDQSWRR
ncbi:hypothetical protein BDZ89DRAFT_1208389 [Hymenopellis radicata]|nr:hypothetical protein BDZ89DRAFT_1208389 [Hymenopellis radicata]